MATLSVLAIGISALSLVSGQGEGACDGACAGTYDKCIGRDIFSLKYCCEENDECVKFSKWYGQCRPKDNDRFDDDWLGVAEDCRFCGVDTLVPGTEFNFFTDIYCELEYLGDYTLAACANQCAQAGNYVACDRYNGVGPDIPSSCYGYYEMFEGGCYTRSENLSFDSWLVCPGNAVIEPVNSDDEPASLSVDTLQEDIAADVAVTDTVDAVAQRALDVAGRR